ncbi:hypothetical protein [Clostridium aminobutyricum]|uniref:Uncharacterized protein n=1 Tax=Clostridium aminobutyricum TaxID=33953 RepID=A0A939IGJ3_CLOAM|nr:hypothetical protein [Clostridium aminobutyricum]MBN7773395.1 hypothetical protein [Clostridium aminobutyricum]
MFEWRAKEKKKSYAQIQLGTSSLVLIFTVLCLVIFSTLSLASAKADHKLAQKNQESVMDYYAADGKAEEILKEINESAVGFKANSTDYAQFQALLYEKFGDAYDSESNRLNYTVDINEEQIILVCLQFLDYSQIGEGKENYKIISWFVQNKVDYEVDDRLPVWDGGTV